MTGPGGVGAGGVGAGGAAGRDGLAGGGGGRARVFGGGGARGFAGEETVGVGGAGAGEGGLRTFPSLIAFSLASLFCRARVRSSSAFSAALVFSSASLFS